MSIHEFSSIFIQASNNSGTVGYRLDWWNHIIDYTFNGDYFWTGKGFGINLGTDSGFDPVGDGKVRSPHNGHITVLARTGVPGLCCWIILQLSWAFSILSNYFKSIRRHQPRWSSVFIALFIYWFALMMSSSFEVIIEGPSGGIWLWSIFGVGLASLYLYQYKPYILDDLN